MYGPNLKSPLLVLSVSRGGRAEASTLAPPTIAGYWGGDSGNPAQPAIIPTCKKFELIFRLGFLTFWDAVKVNALY